jgi:hypothetical protein
VSGAITVLERGRRIDFTFAAMMDFHGGGSPGGVAHAYKVLERALPLLSPDEPPERHELSIETAFGGPGARDAFELVTRAVSEGRYEVDRSLELPERGMAMERFVFRLRYRERSVTLAVCDGYVTDEFIALARRDARTPDEERRLDLLKGEMADRVMGSPAADVYFVLGFP